MNKILKTGLYLLCAVSMKTYCNQPKLIVQLVIDQLRGDLIQRHHKQCTDGGFNYLLQHSINFTNAHHPHANTTTCAGHASIATGSYPAYHGVVDNEWFDRKTKQPMYCMEDKHSPILKLPFSATVNPGRSPKNLMASTLSDEIILARKGKVYAVSFKDRAAITLAGHAGKAFWFDKSNGGFVTSTYYYSQYPEWVLQWNDRYKPKDFVWNLSHPLSFYKNMHSPVFDHKDTAFGQSFPHHVNKAPSEYYFKALSRTPKADELTADFAKELIEQEHIGSIDNNTDYLAISFSAVDAIGHQFGPNSLEAEDNLLSLDNTIGKLLKYIDQKVGLENTLIVLTADHGVSDSPTYLKHHHIHEIKPVPITHTTHLIHSILREQFKLPKKTLLAISPPYIYLDQEIILSKHYDIDKVATVLANALTQKPGIFKAFALPIVTIKKDWLSAKVDRMAYPYRAGDIYIVPPPYQSYGTKNEDRVAHGSPWNYDSFVPLLFVHPKFHGTQSIRPVYTTDIAPTLASILQIKAPSASVGQPLNEVVETFGNPS